MTGADATEEGLSADACPVCGEHRLALVGYPHISTTGVQPFSELLGMREPSADAPPAIGCLACDSQWPDLAALRRRQAGELPPAPPARSRLRRSVRRRA